MENLSFKFNAFKNIYLFTKNKVENFFWQPLSVFWWTCEREINLSQIPKNTHFNLNKQLILN